MNRKEIEKKLFSDEYVDIAFRRYQMFKETELYDESYKQEVLAKLNDQIADKDINPDNVVAILKNIKTSNPQEGSLVHWSNTADLLEYAVARPEDVSTLLDNLYHDKTRSLAERIEEFRVKGKDFKGDISLGAPLFGYLLAAYDYKQYPLYKEDVFKSIKLAFGIDQKLGSVSANYTFYNELCLATYEYLTSQGYTVNMLDMQDFFFCITQYDDPKIESSSEYIQSVAKQIDQFSKDDQAFLETIKSLDSELLKSRRDFYRNGTKINKIRHELLDQYLTQEKLELADLEAIKDKVNAENEKNILNSWNNFTILFQIFYFPIKDRVDYHLTCIHKAIRELDVFTETTFNKDKVINGFSWNNHFGGSRCWIAVYPMDKESHKVAAQLFVAFDAKGMEYGLLYGSEHLNNGEEDLVKITDLKQFSYQQMKNKLKQVYPLFVKGNELAKQPLSLAKPFSVIFDSFEQAEWAFDFALQSLNTLGITEPGDDRIAVTLPSKNKLHIDFCNWLVVGFYKDKNEKPMMHVAMIESEVQDTAYETERFTSKEGESQVVLTKIPIEEFISDNNLQAIYQRTLSLIQEKFQDYTKTPYKKHNIEALENAVFYLEQREVLLQKGLELYPIDQGDIEPEIEIETETEVDLPNISFEQEVIVDNLYYEEKDILLKQIKTALQNGKHIILTGPPGTGKSKLAKEICQSFKADFKMSTATSDWSTYETIGGYKPKSDGTLTFYPGLFLDCFKDARTKHPVNKWLIIDEMNRADIDKAFGALFSALTGDSITLNFQSERGNALLLRPQANDTKAVPNDYEYIIPNDWRIIGTLNTMDKASLYEMSYAFMRRFAFIPVSVPRQINDALVNEYLKKWNIADYNNTETLAYIWKKINQYRQIGPAIIEDIAKYTVIDGDFTSAIILYVLPQFEGLMGNEIIGFISQLEQVEQIKTERLRIFAEDFFQIKG